MTTTESISWDQLKNMPPPKWYETAYYAVPNRISDVSFYIRSLYQRLTRGYSNYEVYEFRTAAAKYMLPRLKAFKATRHGYPGRICSAKDPWSPTREESDAASAKWDSMLDEMIWSLEFYVEEPEWNTGEELAALEARADAGMILLGKWFGSLWD